MGFQSPKEQFTVGFPEPPWGESWTQVYYPEQSSMEFQDPEGTRVALKCTSPYRPLHNWCLKTQYLNLSSDIGIVWRGDHPAIGSCYKPSLMTGHRSKCQTLDKNKYKRKCKEKKNKKRVLCP